MGLTFRNLRSLPAPLVGMFLIFFFVPILSLAIHRPPWEMWFTDGITQTAIVTLTYWICPWALCGAILIRRYLFLPFYLLQCLALAVHSWYYGVSLPLDLEITRYVLVGCMGYIGVLFANKDFLYPFLAKNPRFWRKARRFDVDFPVEIVGDNPEDRIPAMMTNCSVTGMGVRIPQGQFKQLLKRKRRGQRLSVIAKHGPLEVTLPVEVVWLFDYGPYGNLGLRVLQTDRMIEFVASFTGSEETRSPVRTRHAQLLEHDVKQTAFVLWMLFIMLSFSIPALH